MKKQLLTLCFFGMLIGALQAASPKEMIREFVESQEKSVTAYEIAAHFDALMTDPVYGTASVFNVAYTQSISVAALDATHFVVAYRDSGNSSYGTAIVGKVSGTTISSYGAENVFNASETINISLAVLDATHFVIAYGKNGSNGAAIVGEVNQSDISYGAAKIFSSSLTFASIAALDATHFVIVYSHSQPGVDPGEVIVGLVNVTTISYGTVSTFGSTHVTSASIAALDATHFVIIRADYSNSYHGTAIIGEVSGITVSSYGPKNVYNAGSAYSSSLAVLDDTHFVIAYADSGNNSYGTAIIGEVSNGTTISSYGAKNVFNVAETGLTSIAKLDASSFVIVYYSGYYDGGYGCNSGTCTYNSIIGDVSGTTISGYGNQVEIDNSSGESYWSTSVANLGFFITAFTDIGTNQGTTTAASSSALPVELVSFRAIKEETGVKLLWQTVSETNNKGFYIQRSTNTSEWETLGFVEGDGYSVTLNDYQFMDTDPMSGLNYYRLKQIDFDDQFEYSDIVVVNNAVEANVQTFLYPNPTTDRFTFSINNPSELPLTIRLTDHLGRTIWKSERISNTITWEKEFQLTDQGVYLMTTQVGDQLLRERIVVLQEQ